ncbi:hypothetical protein BDV96DRAFT_606245 [Lophiotrema nucula]|uniref:Uncharacterized protein n=1 Tax=Lophiotrema nucula TaxID=690887 RepID=A0A6A5YKQ9_9PLEO|nr:hypothetical protein BDV96DRAFT_606245 [Lophiotrema nucula]
MANAKSSSSNYSDAVNNITQHLSGIRIARDYDPVIHDLTEARLLVSIWQETGDLTEEQRAQLLETQRELGWCHRQRNLSVDDTESKLLEDFPQRVDFLKNRGKNFTQRDELPRNRVELRKQPQKEVFPVLPMEINAKDNLFFKLPLELRGMEAIVIRDSNPHDTCSEAYFHRIAVGILSLLPELCHRNIYFTRETIPLVLRGRHIFTNGEVAVQSFSVFLQAIPEGARYGAVSHLSLGQDVTWAREGETVSEDVAVRYADQLISRCCALSFLTHRVPSRRMFEILHSRGTPACAWHRRSRQEIGKLFVPDGLLQYNRLKKITLTFVADSKGTMNMDDGDKFVRVQECVEDRLQDMMPGVELVVEYASFKQSRGKEDYIGWANSQEDFGDDLEVL